MTDNPLFDETIKDLMKAAKEDGIISSDEYDLIEQIKVDVNAYNDYLKKAFLDGKITSEEENKLNELKQKIIDRAEIKAKIDGEFSADEHALIKKLSEIISERYI